VLFQRGRSGIVLTAEGEVLRRRAEAMDVLLDHAAQEVEAARLGVAASLRIGGTPGALVSLLPRAIERLESRGQAIALQVVERNDGDLLDMLRKGQIELAFVTTEIGILAPDIREVTLSRDPFALIVGRRHTDLPPLVSLRDVRGLPWVLPEAQGAFRRQVDALFAAASLHEPENAIRCDSLLTTKAIVRGSDRVTILPREVAAAELSIGVLRAVAIKEAVFERSVGVRMLGETVLSPLALRLLEALTPDP